MEPGNKLVRLTIARFRPSDRVTYELSEGIADPKNLASKSATWNTQHQDLSQMAKWYVAKKNPNLAERKPKPYRLSSILRESPPDSNVLRWKIHGDRKEQVFPPCLFDF